MLSIVITTHNRLQTLKKCLQALFNSQDPHLISDIVVVDDGSRDETPTWLGQVVESKRITTVVRNRNPVGPAKGRNQGIRRAQSEYTLIIGDDVILFPTTVGLFCDHIRKHQLENSSVIGNIMPVPERMTAFEYWTCNGGSQFGHNRIPRDRFLDAGEEHFYTSNVVTRTALLQEHPFDESFPYARYEDRELAYRLKRQIDHQIHYLEDAKSYHDHRYTFRSWLQRFDRFTWSALHFSNLYPDDHDLKHKLGISRAIEAEVFDHGFLLDAVARINRYHKRFFDSERRFEQRWIREELGTSFRVIQEFFRSNHYRRQLGLPALCDPNRGMDAEDAMIELLQTIEEDV